MQKIVKYILIGVGIVATILAVLAGIVAATFNPNDYKPQIIKLVQQNKQRTLTIPGDIKLTLFPRIGADLGRAAISEHRSDLSFASVERAKVSLALFPLLKKQLVVDRIQVDGLVANLRRNQDGTTNFDDLLGKDEQPSQFQFDIDGVEVRNAKLQFEDRMAGRVLELAKINLTTGRVAEGVPSRVELTAEVKSSHPQAEVALVLKGKLTFDSKAKHYAVKGLTSEVSGQAAGISGLLVKLSGDLEAKPADHLFSIDELQLSAAGKQEGGGFEARLSVPRVQASADQVVSKQITGQFTLQRADGKIEANLSMPGFEGSAKALHAAGLKLELSGKQGASSVKGSLSMPFKANLESGQFTFTPLAAELKLANPALSSGALALTAHGNATVDVNRQTVAASLKIGLDTSNIDAKLGLMGFSAPAYRFDVAIDQLDVDRYQGSPAKSAQSAKGGAKKLVAEAEQPFDVSALKRLNATGVIRVGSLKAANLRASNVKLEIKAAKGRMDVNPLSANLYQGTLNGSMTVTAATPPQFGLRQTLTGVSIGPLLKDAIHKEPLDGKGNMALDVIAHGASMMQLKRGLNGTVRLDVRDGALKGIDLSKTLGEAQAAMGALSGQKVVAASAQERTVFSTLTGSFRIAKGVAHNDDLMLRSSYLLVTGGGDIDLGAERMDFLAKAKVLSTPHGIGELKSLKDVIVPVRASGPFNALQYRLDFSAMVQEAAKQKIEEKKEELKGRVQERLKEQLKGLFGR